MRALLNLEAAGGYDPVERALRQLDREVSGDDVSCQGCGVWFVPTSPTQKYHRPGCAAKHRVRRMRERRRARAEA
jgi:hypothetical protein